MLIDFDQVIPSVVEAMLPRFSHEKLGLAITLDLREDNHDASTYRVGVDASIATIVRFIFHRPGNYTKVLVNYEFNNFHDRESNPRHNEVYFEKHSDHDSCWRSDGLSILRIYRDNVEDYFNCDYNNISHFYNFSAFDPITYVKFEKMESVIKDNNITGYNIKVDTVLIKDCLINKGE